MPMVMIGTNLLERGDGEVFIVKKGIIKLS